MDRTDLISGNEYEVKDAGKWRRMVFMGGTYQNKMVRRFFADPSMVAYVNESESERVRPLQPAAPPKPVVSVGDEVEVAWHNGKDYEWLRGLVTSVDGDIATIWTNDVGAFNRKISNLDSNGLGTGWRLRTHAPKPTDPPAPPPLAVGDYVEVSLIGKQPWLLAKITKVNPITFWFSLQEPVKNQSHNYGDYRNLCWEGDTLVGWRRTTRRPAEDKGKQVTREKLEKIIARLRKRLEAKSKVIDSLDDKLHRFRTRSLLTRMPVVGDRMAWWCDGEVYCGKIDRIDQSQSNTGYVTSTRNGSVWVLRDSDRNKSWMLVGQENLEDAEA